MLDTIGELVRAYQLATVVFVGGSFGRRGGQNILEPAACGKPVHSLRARHFWLRIENQTSMQESQEAWSGSQGNGKRSG